MEVKDAEELSSHMFASWKAWCEEVKPLGLLRRVCIPGVFGGNTKNACSFSGQGNGQ